MWLGEVHSMYWQLWLERSRTLQSMEGTAFQTSLEMGVRLFHAVFVPRCLSGWSASKAKRCSLSMFKFFQFPCFRISGSS